MWRTGVLLLAALSAMAVACGAAQKSPRIPSDPAARARADLLQGDADLEKRDFAAAETAYRAAISKDPAGADAHAGLALALLGQSRTAEALQEAQDAVTAAPGSARAQDAVCVAYLAAGDASSALSHCKEAVRIQDRARWHHDLAIVEAVRDPAAALPEAAQAVEEAPGVEIYVRDEGDLLRRAGQAGAALAKLQEAVKEDPADATAHRMLADALLAAGRIDEALTEIAKALALDPGYALAWNEKGIALEERKDHAGAIAAFRGAIRLAPGVALYHFNLGVELRAAGDPPAGHGGKREGADEIDRAVALAPADGGFLYDDVFAHADLGDLDGAVERARRLVAIDASHGAAHNLLGLMLEREGDAAAAEKEYQEGLRVDPTCAVCHFDYAHALLRAGDLANALGEARIAATDMPKDADAQTLLGVVSYKRGDLATARTQFETALALAPHDPEIHFDLGMTLVGLDDEPGAASELRAFLAAAPAGAPDRAQAQQTLALLAKARARHRPAPATQ